MPLEHWMTALMSRLEASHQRQLLLLQGPRDWCDDQLASIAALEADLLLLSNRGQRPGAVPFSKAATCLGGETRVVAVDLFDGFNPDVLCIAGGLVRAGGVLVLLCGDGDPADASSDRYARWQNGRHSPRAYFVEYFLRELDADAEIGIRLVPDAPRPVPASLPRLEPTPIEDGATREQGAVLQRIEKWLAGGGDGCVLICAERGRGKSTCLGLLAERLARLRRILLSARSRKSAAVLLRRVPQIEFVAPDMLLAEYPAADLLLIDEAAMIPLPMLRQIIRLYPRVVMATTTGGYEGTGQGFLLRFVAELEGRGLTRLRLQAPVRWCEGDLLEAWLERCLLLPAPAGPPPAPAEVDACRIERLSRPGEPGAWPLLRQAYVLLNSAHYRTRPSDLRMLMENPDLRLFVARYGERVLGVALLNVEGGLEPSLCREIFLGRRRPQGHLLAQMLTAQAGLEKFAGYRGLRVQRIAVDSACRRRGLGSRLLAAAVEYGRQRGFDYLGASFAFEPENAEFWRQAGFDPVHGSFARGKSSGNHSIAVLRPINAALEPDIKLLRQRLRRQLPTWLTQFLQFMEPAQVAALLRLVEYRDELSLLERAEVDAFARGNRGFEISFASLQRYVMSALALDPSADAQLLIEKAVQNRPWDMLERESGSVGRRQLQQRLRARVAALGKACYHAGVSMPDPADIIEFWFSGAVSPLWFDSTPDFDRELRETYLETWQRAKNGELEHWLDSAAGCLALVIVLDQFPLNMFRDSSERYSTEAQSRDVARHALEQGFDRGLETARKAFLYMPFMHSEELSDQQLALELFDQPGLEGTLRFARHHHDIIARFGRFPHRNEALGRESTAAEIEYLNSKEAFNA